MPNETLEKLRAEAAANAAGYSRDAKQFAASGQYATAENMRCMSEAWGIVAMRLGQELTKGHCSEGDRCVCGGDLPRVREGCANWVTPNDQGKGPAR